ncbi:cupin domain-containing protein [Pantoea sp. LMR881]|uniref:cupin domain-containing protein n=1 Tax=Pantoea sp. LMR881 TaxID=3014336 RepID=UPI0022AEEC28|nr:cupin domain-containing protein [Pantoea sp. LMR881]MCZ4058015.1 cupin domain-containing protein [Pantoea sp. LMR881]
MLNNILTNFPRAALSAEQETFEDLLRHPDLRIERIISSGQASPPDFWYCQPQAEWVMVVQGAAGLQLENEPQERVLRAGDFLNIPAACRHRVNWTSPEEATVWLAVHYAFPVEEQG